MNAGVFGSVAYQAKSSKKFNFYNAVRILHIDFSRLYGRYCGTEVNTKSYLKFKCPDFFKELFIFPCSLSDSGLLP